MYVVKKKIKGKEYFYLRESKREGKKVISKNVAYLGKTRKEAEEEARKIISEREKIKNIGEQEKIMAGKQDEKKKTIGEGKLTIDELASFCKRKGFVYLSGEIYGGFAGFWDFGHLGVELKNNIKKEWWKYHVQERQDIVGIDGSIITHPKTWEASGHVGSFSDLIVICKKCKKQGKIDRHELGKAKCSCGGEYDEKSAKEVKLMFKTDVGADNFSYLRPETAQLIFTNFKNVVENARLKLPFGIAQIGKAFRNEIAPRDFLFRMREFEQMEIEYFIMPGQKCPYKIGNSEILVYSDEMQEQEKEPEKMRFSDALKKGIIKTDWHAYWLEQEFLWFVSLGANSKKFRIRQQLKDEKSHYALDTWDLEYNFPFGWKELQGMANRADFDLKQHEKFSGTEMKIIDERGEKILPYVVCEPSQGVERAFLVFMFDAYNYDSKRENVVLKLNPKLAPVKAAVFPIVKKPEFVKIAREILSELKKEFNVFYDEGGSIGRRYARMDEIGTIACITIDGQSLKDKTITIRDRDTTEQVRVRVKDLKDILRKLIFENGEFLKVGRKIDTRVK